MSASVLQVNQLNKVFISKGKKLFTKERHETWAVKDISFEVEKGKTLAVIGQSGSGKTTLSRMIIGLEQPTSGDIYVLGQVLTAKRTKAQRKQIQMVFQDSYSTMDPRMSIRRILEEPFRIHDYQLTKTEIQQRILDVIQQVELPVSTIEKFPHELSGGQRQRINIARALIMRPEVIIFDEPTSSLDVSIQAQILNLLKRLQRDEGLTYLFVTHEMGIVRFISDEVMVMYRGECVEYGKTVDVINQPSHPYTKELMDAVPVADPRYKKFVRQSEMDQAKVSLDL